ncbi:MAG TPA: hypothetical protein PKH15_10720, partial [Bacteroidales bacterium]|nr:hypothetical protein [Bacteroidales bacterium]
MKSKILIILLFFSNYLFSQTPTTISVTITNDGNEVARIGRTYTYTYSNWNENCYAWGFDKTNTNLACINGNDQPPWNCANYFTSSSSIESNVVYLNTSTT